VGLEFAPAQMMPSPAACLLPVPMPQPAPGVKAPTLPVAGSVPAQDLQTAPARLLHTPAVPQPKTVGQLVAYSQGCDDDDAANTHTAPAPFPPLPGPTGPLLSPADLLPKPACPAGTYSQEADNQNVGINKLAALALAGLRAGSEGPPPEPAGRPVSFGPEFADGPGTNNLAALSPLLLLPAGVQPEPAGLLPAPADLMPMPTGPPGTCKCEVAGPGANKLAALGPLPPLPSPAGLQAKPVGLVPAPAGVLPVPVGLPGTYTHEVADDGPGTYAALATLLPLPCLSPLL